MLVIPFGCSTIELVGLRVYRTRPDLEQFQLAPCFERLRRSEPCHALQGQQLARIDLFV